MFEDLAEQIKQDERGQSSRWERTLLVLVVLLVTAVIFVGIYMGVRLLD